MSADTLPIGAYGKLPCALEFLRHACYEGSTKLYRSWIDEGHDYLSSRHESSEQGSHFVLFQSSAAYDESLLGVWAPSRDATGTRRFPFTVFARCARDQGGTAISEVGVPHALTALWNALEAQMRILCGVDSSEEFYRLAQDARLQVDNDSSASTSEFETRPAYEWIQSLFHDLDAESAQNQWARGLWYLRSIAPALRAQKQAPLLEAFRLPITTDAPTEAQLAWWLQLLRPLSTRLQQFPTIVLSPEQQRAHLFWRDPSAEDWALVSSDHEVEERLCDVTSREVRLPQSGFDEFSRRIVEQSFDPSRCIADLSQLEVLA